MKNKLIPHNIPKKIEGRVLETAKAAQFDLTSEIKGSGILYPNIMVSYDFRSHNFTMTPTINQGPYTFPEGGVTIDESRSIWGENHANYLAFFGPDTILFIGDPKNPDLGLKTRLPRRNHLLFRIDIPKESMEFPDLAMNSDFLREIEDMGLSVRARKGLQRSRVQTVDQVRQLHNWGIDYSHWILGLGETTYREIAEAIRTRE